MAAASPSVAETPRLARHFGRDGPSSVKSLTTCRTNQLRQHSKWQRPHSLQANQARSTRLVAAKSRLARNWDANPPSLIASRSVSATSRPKQAQIPRKSYLSCHPRPQWVPIIEWNPSLVRGSRAMLALWQQKIAATVPHCGPQPPWSRRPLEPRHSLQRVPRRES